MKEMNVAMALLIGSWITAGTASAALQYDFVQTSRADFGDARETRLGGKVLVDGGRTRIDFVEGTAYPIGSYVISTDGTRTYAFVDPSKKSYFEVKSDAATAALAPGRVTISNIKQKFEPLDDHPTIAGYPTNHYRLTLSYDVKVTFGSIPVQQAVQTVIDKWMTTAFGEVIDPFAADSKTGNPELDELIAMESTRMKGLALRQTVSVVTSNDITPLPGSELAKQLRPSRTQSRELVITSVREAKATQTAFLVPPSYRKVDGRGNAAKKTQVQILSMEPPTK